MLNIYLGKTARFQRNARIPFSLSRSGYAKAKTGNKTSAETYANWYKSVYLPEPKAVDADTEGSAPMRRLGRRRKKVNGGENQQQGIFNP